MRCYYCGCKVEAWSFLMYARDGAGIGECDACYLDTDVKTKQDLFIDPAFMLEIRKQAEKDDEATAAVKRVSSRRR